MADAATVTRNLIGDYMSAVSPVAFTPMGFAIQIDENPNPKMDETPFTNNTIKSSSVVGYERTFPFDLQLRTSQAATLLLLDIARNDRIGAAAQVYYVRADLYKAPVLSAYPARKFLLTVEVTSLNEGAGMEIVHIKGNFHQCGAAVEGDYNPTTNTFTADA